MLAAPSVRSLKNVIEIWRFGLVGSPDLAEEGGGGLTRLKDDVCPGGAVSYTLACNPLTGASANVLAAMLICSS